ncbi:hypothetical protein [Actinomadura sediminis]|uniref:Uncharacterized protein n=1 Tax=Actinomadura sediminis TaxID=1038904 RepID=A0ABW3EPP1_9ACTN
MTADQSCDAGLTDRLGLLKAALHGKGYEAEIDDGVLTVYGAERGGSIPAITITCKRRPADGDRWWYWAGGAPVDEATHVTDAVVWIMGRLAGAPA